MDAVSVTCDYLHIGEGYDRLVNAIGLMVEEGDLVVISETPISIVEGSVVDESVYGYGLVSLFICEVWCRFLWGYVFGVFWHDSRTVSNLRRLPVEARNHKEFIRERFGLKHALMPSGEAGVDLSNVPDSFVSLLPVNPYLSACTIRDLICERFGVGVEVMIIDTDPTYEYRGKLFTSIPLSVEGIVCDTGVYGYFLRFVSKYVGATPLASTLNLNAHKLIRLANIAEKCQEKELDDFFETIYNMTDRFDVDFSDVSYDMLEKQKHIPAVIIRSKYL